MNGKDVNVQIAPEAEPVPDGEDLPRAAAMSFSLQRPTCRPDTVSQGVTFLEGHRFLDVVHSEIVVHGDVLRGHRDGQDQTVRAMRAAPRLLQGRSPFTSSGTGSTLKTRRPSTFTQTELDGDMSFVKALADHLRRVRMFIETVRLGLAGLEVARARLATELTVLPGSGEPTARDSSRRYVGTTP